MQFLGPAAPAHHVEPPTTISVGTVSASSDAVVEAFQWWMAGESAVYRGQGMSAVGTPVRHQAAKGSSSTDVRWTSLPHPGRRSHQQMISGHLRFVTPVGHHLR